MDEEDSIFELSYEKIYEYAIYLFGGILVLTIVIWCACIFCCNCLRRKKKDNLKVSEDDDILAADPSMSKQDLINLKKRREKEKLAK